ncbi:MAG: alkyl hydroperoxide reductase [Phycisphaerales bacterium]
MSDSPAAASTPSWMTKVLIIAGIYNLLWGAVVVLAPLAIFRFLKLPDPTYPSIWQCVGMIVGVYGIGYLAAAKDPARHWPIVLVGLLGKIFGPIGFVHAAMNGIFPWKMGFTIITNDLIWWIPFGLMLLHARRVALASAASTVVAPAPVSSEPVS